MRHRPREASEHDLVRLYLDEIGRYALLTKEEEVELARRVEAGRAARRELESAPELDAARRRELRAIVRDGDEATQTFVNANLRLVVSIAKRFQSSETPLLDLIQDGNLGLMHAVEKFDWRRGYKFSTYATWWIRQAIGRGIDNTSRTIRLPMHVHERVRRLRRVRTQLEASLGRAPTIAELAERLEVPETQAAELIRVAADPISLAEPIGDDGDGALGDLVADPGAVSPFDAVAQQFKEVELERFLSVLDEREREILTLRFGLDRGDPRTLEEVGHVLHLTRERIRQLERKAIAKLRQAAGDEVKELLAS